MNSMQRQFKFQANQQKQQFEFQNKFMREQNKNSSCSVTFLIFIFLFCLLIALSACSSAKFNQRWDYALNQALDNPNTKIIIINNKQLQVYDKDYNLITEVKK